MSEAGASVYSASEFASQELPGPGRVAARRGVDRAPPAGPAGGAGEDRSEVDRRRPVPARRQPVPAGALARCGGGGLRERGGRRRQHRLGAAAGAGVRAVRQRRAKHRGSSRCQGPVRDARRPEEGAAPGRQDLRAGGRIPAHHGRRQSARCLGGAPRSPIRWSSDPRRHQEGHQRGDRRQQAAQVAEPGQVRRRTIRPADDQRHPERTGETRPRPASRIQTAAPSGKASKN